MPVLINKLQGNNITMEGKNFFFNKRKLIYIELKWCRFGYIIITGKLDVILGPNLTLKINEWNGY